MQVRIQDALGVFSRFGPQNVPLVFLTDVRLRGDGGAVKRFPRGTRFDNEVAEVLQQLNISEVDFLYTEKLSLALRRLYPERYRAPFATLSFVELDKSLHALQAINRKSNRRREIVSGMELYRRNEKKLEVLLEYGQTISAAFWNDLKTRVEKKQRFDIRFSESGIIVFVDLRPEGGNYLQRFYRNSDLVTSLVGQRSDEHVRIAPDFNGELDVFAVDDPDKLLDTYINRNARLIIIGDELSEDYKVALAKVKGYDPFARFMLATNIDQGHLDSFLIQVKKSYVANNFNIDDF